MKNQPVTTTYFNPVQAAAAKQKAKELADGNDARLVMIRPDVYIIMNSADHAANHPKMIKRIRKEYGLA